MKYSEAKGGRIFIIRLEDGDIIHESIESFAIEQSITAASLIILGGADTGSVLVTGPEQGRQKPIIPQTLSLSNVHEVTGTGTIFPDENGRPVLHMHIAAGRHDNTITGCIREGVKAWHVLEIILYELTETKAKRVPDKATGFHLLWP